MIPPLDEMAPVPREIAIGDQATMDALLAHVTKIELDPLRSPFAQLFSVPVVIDAQLPPGWVEIRDADGKPTGALCLVNGTWVDALINHCWTRGLMLAAGWLDQIRERTNLEPTDAQKKRITDDCFRNRPCRDCAAPIGRPHDDGCDVPICLWTGIQRLQCDGYLDNPNCRCRDEEVLDDEGYLVHSCGEQPHDCGQQVWDGVWPGYAECIEYGWFSWFAPPWRECGPEHPGAVPDLTRLHLTCDWDRTRSRWVWRGRE